MNKKIALIILLTFSYFGFSQTIEVSGKVLDANSNQPLPGASVSAKNAKQSVTTDFDGNFKISKLYQGDVLVISYIGYKNYQQTITKSDKIIVKLIDDNKSLDEVVVIGYGSVKKKDVTGSLSIVSAKTIEDLRPVKIEQALQGTVAGVNVTSQSGSPGAGFDIRIRGIGTNVDNTPTAIIDGYIGDLSLLNPNDIETFKNIIKIKCSV